MRNRIKHRYTSRVMRGFAGSFSEEKRAELEKHEAVKYVGESVLELGGQETELTRVLDPQSPTDLSPRSD